MKNIVVQKYGGTSVGDVKKIFNVAKRIIATRDEGNDVIAVVSAMGDSTDKLIEMAHSITLKPSSRELDMLVTTGEQVSASMLAMAINSLGVSCVSLNSEQAGITTVGRYKNSRIDDIDTTRLKNELKSGKIIIVTGFQGMNKIGDVTTLGRGGSDTSAVAIACALGANKCEIYTDVDGVYTTDPRKVASATKIDKISYDEMLELASLGAGILHPRAVELARKNDLTMFVRSSLNNNSGTEISGVDSMEKAIVSGVALDEDIAKISVMGVPDKPGVAFRLFSALAANGVYFDMIIQNVTSKHVNDITFTVKSDELDEALAVTRKVAQEIGAEEVVYDRSVVKISIVGTGIAGSAEIASAFFQTLYDLAINIDMISTSEIKISCIIEEDKSLEDLNAMHDCFELDKK